MPLIIFHFDKGGVIIKNYIREHTIEAVLRLLLSAVLAVFVVTRVTGLGISMRFAVYCVMVLVATVAILFLTQKLPARPQYPVVFAIFLVLGFLFDPSDLYCNISQYTLQGLLYLVCGVGNGIILGYLADNLFEALRLVRIRLGGLFWGTVAVWNLFAIWYTLSSKIVYYWDNAGYWDTTKAISAFNAGFFEEVIYSIQFSDYNNLITLPIAVIVRIFGGSRLVYVLAILNLYLLPAYALLFQIVKKRLLLVLLSPAPVFMLVTGFIDIGGLLVGTLVLYFALGSQFSPKQQYFAVGICTVMTFVLRRYQMFYAFAFLAVFFCVEFALRPENRRHLWVLVATPLGFAFYVMQPFILDNVIHSTLSEEYVGYQLGLTTDFLFFVRYFGLLWLVLMAVAVVRGWFTEERRKVLLCGGTFLLCFFLFTLLQSHGQQHLLMYFPLYLVLICTLAESFEGRRVHGMFLACAVATSLYPFVPKEQPSSISEIDSVSVLPSFTLIPSVRDDINDLVALKQYVDGLSTEEDVATVALLSSSLTLNLSTMVHLYPSLNMADPAVESRWVYIPEVDERDTFDSPLLLADYVLVASPLQIHLEAEHQDVIGDPYEQFMGEGYPDYVMLEETLPVGDITVYVFQCIAEH